MLPNSITIQFQGATYSHPILYGEYVNETLYLIHPDKKIALNIPTQKLETFIESVFSNIQSKFQQDIPCFLLKSFETIAKENNYKIKKRKKLLPEAIIFIPSQENSKPIIQTDTFVSLTPLNEPIYFDYPKPDKTKFINQISNLQKKLNKDKHNINFKYIYHSKEDDQKIISDQNLNQAFILKTPDFTIASSTTLLQKPNLNQDILFTENHPRNFQMGQLKVTKNKTTNNYTLDNSTSIIQTNVQKNLTLKINKQSKPFDLFKKLSKAINQVKND